MQAAAELSAGLPGGVQGGQLPVEIVVLRPQNSPLRGGQLTQQDHIIAVGEHLGDMDGRPVLRRGGQVHFSKAGGQKFLVLGRSPQKAKIRWSSPVTTVKAQAISRTAAAAGSWPSSFPISWVEYPW